MRFYHNFCQCLPQISQKENCRFFFILIFIRLLDGSQNSFVVIHELSQVQMEISAAQKLWYSAFVIQLSFAMNLNESFFLCSCIGHEASSKNMHGYNNAFFNFCLLLFFIWFEAI